MLRDNEGISSLGSILASLAATDFDRSRLDEILQAGRAVPNPWQIGEAMAEAYLETHEQCSFPWPSTRDLRNPQASPAGADLVGFCQTGPAARFAFGEVKTSADPSRPPSVVTGRHGLIRQLEGLRDHGGKRNALVLYLGHRAPGQEWESDYKQAFRLYLADASAVALYGFLIRDVQPDRRDLSDLTDRLASGCPESTWIGLYALYLPVGCLAELPGRWTAIQEQGRS